MSVAMKLSYKRDTNDPLVTQAPVTLLMQGDNQANVIELTLMDGETPASLSGYTATVYLQRADGVRVRCPGSVSGNVATVPLQAECYSVPGQYAAIMKLSGPNELRTVLRLAGYVESDGQGVIIDPSGSIPSYEDLERIIQELEEALQHAETATSSANTAAQNANTAAGSANTAAGAATTAAGNATTATSRANTAAASIEGLTVEASDVAYNQPATATVTDVEGHKHIAFGLRQGVPGAVPKLTFTGETGEPNTDVVITQSGPPEAPVVNLKIPQGVPGTGNVSTVDGVGPDAGGNVALSAVRYAAQTLNDAQKVQARKNIGVDGQVYLCTAQALEAMSQEQQAELYKQGYEAIKTENNGTVVLLGLAEDGSLEWLGCNQPRGNLLDNPDFAIAQAGYGGLHGTSIYAADRWPVYNATLSSGEEGKITIVGGESEGNIYQRFFPTSGPVTIGYFDASENLHLINANIPDVLGAGPILIASNQYIQVFVNENTIQVNFVVNAGETITFAKAFCYSGSYTQKTLPPWVAPDPVADLIKCQNYFRPFPKGAPATIDTPSGVNARAILDPPMRSGVNPTVTMTSGATANTPSGAKSVTVSYQGVTSPDVVSFVFYSAEALTQGTPAVVTGINGWISSDL